MKLYNVTFKDCGDTTLLPYIPYSAGDDEDKETARICLSSSIRGCIQAIGPADRFIATGSKFTVRESEITDSENLINPMQLFLSHKVPDALENMEYWYLKPLSVELHVYEIIECGFDYTISWSCIRPQDIRDIITQYTLDRFPQPTSKQIYEAAMKQLLPDVCDNVWEDLAELPWAQKIMVTKLVVRDTTTKLILKL